MNVPDLPKRLTRRRVLAVVAGGFSVLGWFGMDPMGDVTPDSPPYDLDGDGLFEDVNGDGALNYRDPLMDSHESREEFASEAVPSAFNYAYPNDGSDFVALADYTRWDDQDGLWTPDGDPLDLEFYASPAVSESAVEQARQHATSALNNASMRTDGDWYADIGVDRVAGLDEDYVMEPGTEAAGEAADEIAATVEETVTDGSEYTDTGLGVILLDSGDPAAFLAADGDYAVVTGMQVIDEYPGTPLFTQNRADVAPVRGVGGVLGMETSARPLVAADDEFVATVYSVLDPMYANSIEDRQEFYERGGATASDESRFMETRRTDMAYTPLFSRYTIADWQPRTLETR